MGSPCWKDKRRHFCAVINELIYMDLCWEKIIVSVTYQREGVEIKNGLTSLKLSVSSFLCAPPAVLQPLYGFYFNQYEMIKERANWVQLSEVSRFLVNSFDIC